jgi:hypothetical protein
MQSAEAELLPAGLLRLDDLGLDDDSGGSETAGGVGGSRLFERSGSSSGGGCGGGGGRLFERNGGSSGSGGGRLFERSGESELSLGPLGGGWGAEVCLPDWSTIFLFPAWLALLRAPRGRKWVGLRTPSVSRRVPTRGP